MPYVTQTIPTHLLELADNMREADRAEIAAARGLPPLLVLEESYVNSTKCYTVMTDDHKVVGIFGVTAYPETPGMGHPWMMATDALKDIKFTFLKQCEAYVQDLREGFTILMNVCDKRNSLHIRWLKWLGFLFIKEHPHYGVGGLPFYEFIMLGDSDV